MLIPLPTPCVSIEYKIGWTIYAGWMPWPYAQQAGIVKKWADKYGVKINWCRSTTMWSR
jgi:NitT/TauT family transport system substrate-binding protein